MHQKAYHHPRRQQYLQESGRRRKNRERFELELAVSKGFKDVGSLSVEVFIETILPA